MITGTGLPDSIRVRCVLSSVRQVALDLLSSRSRLVTSAVTILRAGTKDNVLPQRAVAVVQALEEHFAVPARAVAEAPAT